VAKYGLLPALSDAAVDARAVWPKLTAPSAATAETARSLETPTFMRRLSFRPIVFLLKKHEPLTLADTLPARVDRSVDANATILQFQAMRPGAAAPDAAFAPKRPSPSCTRTNSDAGCQIIEYPRPLAFTAEKAPLTIKTPHGKMDHKRFYNTLGTCPTLSTPLCVQMNRGTIFRTTTIVSHCGVHVKRNYPHFQYSTLKHFFAKDSLIVITFDAIRRNAS
jgi:hypothetical protein